MSAEPNECISCEEATPERCAASKRSCGHHCNHSWTSDSCCWCKKQFGALTEIIHELAKRLGGPEGAGIQGEYLTEAEGWANQIIQAHQEDQK